MKSVAWEFSRRKERPEALGEKKKITNLTKC